MKSTLARLLCRMLVICMIGLPLQVHAGLIGTDAVVSAAQATAARDTLARTLNRSDVAAQLQAMGLSPQQAKDRVAALTDSEAAKLAAQIDSLPAGANSAGAVVLLIVIAVLIWWAVKK